jgi:hypothetical protein
MPLAGAEARWTGGAAPLATGSSEPADPSAYFEVRLTAPVRGARLVLLDSQDVLVPATVDAEVGPASRFTLAPLEPLRAGGAYTLRLEGVAGRLVDSGDGRAFEPLVLPIRVSGTPPPRAPPKKTLKKRAP